jgi:CspA family cold shock protein
VYVRGTDGASVTRRSVRGTTMAATNGTIKRLTDKGFGFIAAADGTEYFFHQSAVQGSSYNELREGQRVTFTVGQGPKGPRAENVRPE